VSRGQGAVSGPPVDLLRDPGFWEAAWREASRETAVRRGGGPRERLAAWDARADRFKDHVLGARGRQRIDRVVDWLRRQGVVLSGLSVLDIGAGPGAFALDFAGRGCTVTAVEPSTNMAALLRREAARAPRNIDIVIKPWEDIIPAEERWEQRFDLVFASMCPGINSRQTLEKALACSRRYCYCSGFAGRRTNSALEQLWPVLFGEEMPDWPGDILHMINLLYTSGHDLTLHLWEDRRRSRVPVDEAVADLLEAIPMYGGDPSGVQQGQVEAFVRAGARHGEFTYETTSRLGQILVRLDLPGRHEPGRE